MPSPSEIVRQVLIDAGVAVLPRPSWSNAAKSPVQTPPQAYTSSMPDEVDTVMLVKNQQGLVFGKDMRTNTTWSHKGVKILVRSVDDRSGYDIMASVVEAIKAFTQPRSVPVRGTYCQLHSLYLTGDIIDLGEEQGTRRQLHSLNLRVVMEDNAEVPME